MSCIIYRDLEIKLNTAKARWAQFAYKQNRHLWGTSATQARRIAADAQRQMGEFSQKMLAHQEQCPYCLVAKPSAAGNSD